MQSFHKILFFFLFVCFLCIYNEFLYLNDEWHIIITANEYLTIPSNNEKRSCQIKSIFIYLLPLGQNYFQRHSLHNKLSNIQHAEM